jgi:hypothetical protein
MAIISKSDHWSPDPAVVVMTIQQERRSSSRGVVVIIISPVRGSWHFDRGYSVRRDRRRVQTSAMIERSRTGLQLLLHNYEGLTHPFGHNSGTLNAPPLVKRRFNPLVGTSDLYMSYDVTRCKRSMSTALISANEFHGVDFPLGEK